MIRGLRTASVLPGEQQVKACERQAEQLRRARIVHLHHEKPITSKAVIPAPGSALQAMLQATPNEPQGYRDSNTRAHR